MRGYAALLDKRRNEAMHLSHAVWNYANGDRRREGSLVYMGGLGAALFSIIVRDSYISYKLGFEWVHFPDAVVDIAVVVMALLAALIVRGVRLSDSGAKSDG